MTGPRTQSRTAAKGTTAPDTVVTRIRAAAWSGSHPTAIALATEALETPRLGAPKRVHLLDLRAESHIAVGDLEAARADGRAMLAAATTVNAVRAGAGLAAAARARLALVDMRAGRMEAALREARKAVAAAQRSRDDVVTARALLTLAEAEFRNVRHARAAEPAREAARLYAEVGDRVGEGRALWCEAVALSGIDDVANARERGERALAIARETGDLFGAGNALNTLHNVQSDINDRIRTMRQALDAFEAAGYVERAATALFNLAGDYTSLGLARRALRAAERGLALLESRQQAMTGFLLSVIVDCNVRLRRVDAAGSALATFQRYVEAMPQRLLDDDVEQLSAMLALVRGDARAAIRHAKAYVARCEHFGNPVRSADAHALLAEALLAGGNPRAALAAARRGVAAIESVGQKVGDFQSRAAWPLATCATALAANGRADEARAMQDRAYAALLADVVSLRDEGLRRNYFNKQAEFRPLIMAIAARALADRKSRPPSLPHLASGVDARAPFERLVEAGMRLNALRTRAEIHDFLVDEATELSGAERVLVVAEANGVTTLVGSETPVGDDAAALFAAGRALFDRVRETRAPLLEFTPARGNALAQRSRIVVPLIAQQDMLGYVYADIDGAFGRFHDGDRDLLAMLASQGAIALANAQWSEGLEQKVAARTNELRATTAQAEQRASELALINSIQQGIASALDFQGIVDLVGDKLREVLGVGHLAINWFEPVTGMIHNLYVCQHHVRLSLAPNKPMRGGAWEIVRASRQPLFIADQAQENFTTQPGSQTSMSEVVVPIQGAGGQVLGLLGIESFDRVYRPGDSEVRLLQTVASSMGVALENARNFDATQRLLAETAQRNAELAIINSVQRAVAGELTMQGVYDAVGDRIREVFGHASFGIRIFDRERGVSYFPYAYGPRKRVEIPPQPLTDKGFAAEVVRTGKTLVISENLAARMAESGSYLLSAELAVPKTQVMVPLTIGGQVRGLLQLSDDEKEHAFSADDVRLLETLAATMAISLENARLFDETQRLLAETERRNAELSIINEIQRGVSAALDFQAIVDTVGDRLRSVFDVDNALVAIMDDSRREMELVYIVEHGARLPAQRIALRDTPAHRALAEGRTLVVNRPSEYNPLGMITVPGTDSPVSGVYVPIMVGGTQFGNVALENFERESAFDADAVRLLETIVGAMGVALSNARSYAETQRLLQEAEERNAQLAVITSVQKGMVANLEFQAIVDLVGDELRRLFDSRDVGIIWFDPATQMTHPLYIYEHGTRLHLAPRPTGRMSLATQLVERGEIVVAGDLAEQERLGMYLVPGTDRARSVVMVPVMIGGVCRAQIQLENFERDHAFDAQAVSVLATIAASMAVALENARNFDETQRLLKETEQRNAELAVINEIQRGMSAELDFRTIVDLVGDKLRDVLKTGEIGIRWLDYEHRTVHHLYEFEHGVRLSLPPHSPGDNWERLAARRDVRVRNTQAEMAVLGALPGTELGKSGADVPIIAGDRMLGSIVVEDYEREYAFSDADIRLLTTVGSAMGAALENARLFDETQRLLKETEQRAAELGLINSIQQGIASNLDFDGIVNLVGDKLRDVLHTGEIGIRWLDYERREVRYLYEYEHGTRLDFPPQKVGDWDAYVQRRSVQLRRDAAAMADVPIIPGTDRALCNIMVPMVAGDRLIGSIVVENYERENAFSESDIRLLTTVAASMGVALENARLFGETQRLLTETEQRAAELGVINSIQQGVAAELDFQAIVDLVGDKLRQVFRTGDMMIGWYDAAADSVQIPYCYEHGERRHIKPFAPTVAFRRMQREGKPIVCNTPADYAPAGLMIIEGTDHSRSSVLVPMLGA
ncbi:MAG: GAF domain-containing protein, partial [Proteobacteria bacterium]|nr:GAF domain-containing protein [Pseudomonadota bacterium]